MTTHTSTVTLPPEYFRRALKDYSDWHFALIREFVQNSADAGATRVELMFDRGARTITCVDDGRGCSAATIRNKLLVLGGSEKPDGAVGGFGLAKELLYFAHPRWIIRTRDVLVEGAYGTFTLTTGHESLAGFIATIQPADDGDLSLAQYATRRFARAFDRPDCALWVNGERFEPSAAMLRAGKRAIKVFEWGKVYRTKDMPMSETSLWIRTGGLPSAQEYVGDLDASLGTLFVELTGASSDILTVSRERLRNYAHRTELAAFLRSLVTDGRKAVDDRDPDEEPVALFFDADDVEALLEGAAQGEKSPEDMTPDELAAELAGPAALGQVSSTGGRGGLAFVATAANMAALARGGEAPARGKMARTPPMLSKADLPSVGAGKLGVRVSAKGVGAAQKYLRRWHAKRDLAVWATACEAICAAIGRKLDTVGFTFDPTVDAEAVTASGRFALFVNPAAFEKATSANVAEEALDVAVHEVAHITCPGGHTEAWALEEMRIRRALRGTDTRRLIAKAQRTCTVERKA